MTPELAGQAFVAFTTEDEPLEFVIGRLLMILDAHGLLDEVTR